METRVGSRAFTIVYILLGASCVGGALVLFMKDIMEGIVDLRHDTFEKLLAADAVNRIATSQRGRLTYQEFRMLVEEWTNKRMNDATFVKLCRMFDPFDKGFVKSEAFIRKCHEMETLLWTQGPLYSDRLIVRKAAQGWEVMKALCDEQNRIFTVFVIWLSIGIW